MSYCYTDTSQRLSFARGLPIKTKSARSILKINVRLFNRKRFATGHMKAGPYNLRKRTTLNAADSINYGKNDGITVILPPKPTFSMVSVEEEDNNSADMKANSGAGKCDKKDALKDKASRLKYKKRKRKILKRQLKRKWSKPNRKTLEIVKNAKKETVTNNQKVKSGRITKKYKVKSNMKKQQRKAVQMLTKLTEDDSTASPKPTFSMVSVAKDKSAYMKANSGAGKCDKKEALKDKASRLKYKKRKRKILKRQLTRKQSKPNLKTLELVKNRKKETATKKQKVKSGRITKIYKVKSNMEEQQIKAVQMLTKLTEDDSTTSILKALSSECEGLFKKASSVTIQLKDQLVNKSLDLFRFGASFFRNNNNNKKLKSIDDDDYWPNYPPNRIAKTISRMPITHKIIDYYCEKSVLGEKVPQKVKSIKLSKHKDYDVLFDNMAHSPLEENSQEVVVFCLSLMGNDLRKYMFEANRVLKVGGLLFIAEMCISTDNVLQFELDLMCCGFDLLKKITTDNIFCIFLFKKICGLDQDEVIAPFTLTFCKYRKNSNMRTVRYLPPQ